MPKLPHSLALCPLLLGCLLGVSSPLSAVHAQTGSQKGAAPVAAPDQLTTQLIGPTYQDAPEVTRHDNVPQGNLYAFTLASTASKIYPGIAKNQPGVVPYQRQVLVYVPQQYVAGRPAPFLVVQDGLSYRNVLPTVLDNLIAAKRVPALLAILLDSGGGDAQGSERGLEYDTVSDTYARFIETEVLPALTHRYGLVFTTDPEGRATMGGSSGGAAAFTMAWFHPEWYRRVLTYSGTYVNQQSPLNPALPHGAWEYHERLIAQSPSQPLRVWLEVSAQDIGADRDEASLHNWVLANQRMAAALQAKGYPCHYVFAQEAKHVDARVTRQTLPDALSWLWQDYRPQ